MLDKDQANAASEALMAQAKAEQSRQAERFRVHRPSTAWRVLGLGLMGSGVGIATGADDGHGAVFGAVGLAVGLALGALAARRQA